MKFFAWSFLNSPKIGRWKSFNKSMHAKRGKKKKTWRGCFSQTKWVPKKLYCWMLWYLLFEHLWKTPSCRRKLHPKSEKNVLQISHLIFGCCRVAKYLVYEFTFIFHYFSCWIKQSMIDNHSFRPPQMYLEYLDTDKMRGKVEQIYLKYFDAAKMRGKVGTLIRDKMNRLHVLHYYRLKEHHKSWKVKVWKERKIF